MAVLLLAIVIDAPTGSVTLFGRRTPALFGSEGARPLPGMIRLPWGCWTGRLNSQGFVNTVFAIGSAVCTRGLLIAAFDLEAGQARWDAMLWGTQAVGKKQAAYSKRIS